MEGILGEEIEKPRWKIRESKKTIRGWKRKRRKKIRGKNKKNREGCRRDSESETLEDEEY